MSIYDDPNRECVGLDPAWVEGTGGTPGTEQAEPAGQQDDGGEDEELESMTKADLLALAKERGVSPANNDMTKQELIDAIRGRQTG
jgi:Rho termination factor, N-terminal domain